MAIGYAKVGVHEVCKFGRLNLRWDEISNVDAA